MAFKPKGLTRKEVEAHIYREVSTSPARTVDMAHLKRTIDASYSTIHYGLRALRECGKIESWATKNPGVNGTKAVYVVAGTPMDGYTKIQQVRSGGEDFAVDIVPYVPPKPKVFVGNRAVGKRTVNGTVFNPNDYGPQDVVRVGGNENFRAVASEIANGYQGGGVAVEPAPGRGMPLRIKMHGKKIGSLV